MFTTYRNPTRYDVRRDLVPPHPNSYCIVNLLVLRTTWGWPTYKAETCSCCILHSVAYYIVILSDKLLCFLLHVYVNTHIIIYIVLWLPYFHDLFLLILVQALCLILPLLQVKCRWAYALSCFFTYSSLANIGHAAILRSIFSSCCWHILHLLSVDVCNIILHSMWFLMLILCCYYLTFSFSFHYYYSISMGDGIFPEDPFWLIICYL